MPRKKTPPPCETLSAAASMLLRLPVSQFHAFEPRTAAESAIYTLAEKTLRGDAKAFESLMKAVETADKVEIIEENIDGLSKSLEELARAMEAGV